MKAEYSDILIQTVLKRNFAPSKTKKKCTKSYMHFLAKNTYFLHVHVHDTRDMNVNA